MKNYIYLDWNVIQYMKHNTITSSFDAVKFNEFINELAEKYSIPASNAHLRDLASSFNENNKNYIEEDIDFLRKISKGLMLGVSPNELPIPIEADVSSEFEKIISEKNIDLGINIVGGSYEVDMGKLSKDSLFRPFLEKSGGALNANVMEDFIRMIWESIDDPEMYKKFRHEVSNLKSSFENNQTILNNESPYFKKIETFLDFFEINNEYYLLENFSKIQESFLAIDGRKLAALTKWQKIENAYSLLDFHPLFKEKINKKNKPGNVHRDLNHFFFASDAKYFVTEDDSTYRKSRFVARALGLKVRVMKMDELRLKITCI